MPEIEPEDDGIMEADQQARAARLSETELRLIDDCILSNITHRFQKTARVVVFTMQALGDMFPDLPDLFYSGRIKHLAEAGLIEAAGNLNRMRFSEVRLSVIRED